MTKPTETEFREHVAKSFAYLTDEFGFAPKFDDSRLETFHCLYEGSELFVSIRGVDSGAGTEVRIGVLPYKTTCLQGRSRSPAIRRQGVRPNASS